MKEGVGIVLFGERRWCGSVDTGFGEGSWFEEKLRRVVGDDVNITFGLLGGIHLKEQFRRLFKLSMNQWVSVTYMFSLGWKEGG